MEHHVGFPRPVASSSSSGGEPLLEEESEGMDEFLRVAAMEDMERARLALGADMKESHDDFKVVVRGARQLLAASLQPVRRLRPVTGVLWPWSFAGGDACLRGLRTTSLRMGLWHQVS